MILLLGGWHGGSRYEKRGKETMDGERKSKGRESQIAFTVFHQEIG